VRPEGNQREQVTLLLTAIAYRRRLAQCARTDAGFA
jgi:hypothetical protein